MITIHLVSHTHWDREWYLTFQQFRLKLIHLIDYLLDILETDPDFKYFLLDGQTIILEDYLQIRPERETDLIKFIKNGRLLIGPWYISPDEYLVAPESHIRNLLEGNHFCQKYGGKMSVGYLPDTFGHIGQMPQILQGFGIDAACLWRGLDDQSCELLWKAPDGSSVLLSYLRDSYSNAANLTTSDPDRFVNEIHEKTLSLLPYSLTGQILLMHGTDHMAPPKDLSCALRIYQLKPGLYNLIHSNLPQYFDSVHSQLTSTGIQLPVINGELRSSKHSALLQNTLSTRIWLKQRNHDCENDLLKWVEPLNAWEVNLLDPPQSTQAPDNQNNTQRNFLDHQNSIIRYAWKLLMQCHPHDSICGTSIDQVASEMRVRFYQVDQINHVLINQDLQRLSNQIDTRYFDRPNLSNNKQNILSSIIVFNPNDKAQSGLINLNIKFDDQYSSFEIIDESGNTIPFHQRELGPSELISMTLDKQGLKQALGMINKGNVAGMVVRDFEIEYGENSALIRATLSDHGMANLSKLRRGISQLEEMFADPKVSEFVIHAYSDPEIETYLVARDVPGHGYCSYWIRGNIEQMTKTSEPKKLNSLVESILPLFNLITRTPVFSKLVIIKKQKSTKKLNKIENEFFIVEVHPTKGSISVTDKRSQQVYTGLNRFIDNADCGDLYNYSPPENDLTVFAKVVKVENDENVTGHRLIIYSELKTPSRISDDRKSRSHEWVNNKIKSTITVVPGIPRIDVHTEIGNQASDHRLRVHFPAPFYCANSIQDGHYEIVQRPVGTPNYDDTWEEPPRPEVPQCQFTIVADDQTSLTIANRGLPEVEVLKTEKENVEIAITLLRCVGWLSRDDITTRKGHAGPMGIATPEAQMIGMYSFDYSIIPGDKNWISSIHEAYSFNSPLKAINSPVHPGILPCKISFIENQNQDFILTAIKQADDNSDLIVRGFNISSSPIEISIKPWRQFKHAHLVGLDEKIIKSLSISEQGQVNLLIDGNKIVTIRFDD
jgi:mannosylglycerate hydrolase